MKIPRTQLEPNYNDDLLLEFIHDWTDCKCANVVPNINVHNLSNYFMLAFSYELLYN